MTISNRNRLTQLILLSMVLLLPLSSQAEENSRDESSSSDEPPEEGTSVYRSLDEQGRPVFSDKGSADAEKIKVREPMTFPAGAFKKPSRNLRFESMQSEEDEVKFVYEKLLISDPQDDAAIRSNSGELTVTPYLSPALYSTHRLQLVVDEQVYATNRGDSFQLANLDRGVHVLHLQIVDVNDDTIVKASDPISISILRASILHPGRKKS